MSLFFFFFYIIGRLKMIQTRTGSHVLLPLKAEWNQTKVQPHPLSPGKGISYKRNARGRVQGRRGGRGRARTSSGQARISGMIEDCWNATGDIYTSTTHFQTPTSPRTPAYFHIVIYSIAAFFHKLHTLKFFFLLNLLNKWLHKINISKSRYNF